MKRTQFWGVLVAATCGMGLVYYPHPAFGQTLSDAVNAAQRPDRDFFEIGIEQFEQEIERLMEPPPETPLLTLDETVQFDSDAQERELNELRDEPISPDSEAE